MTEQNTRRIAWSAIWLAGVSVLLVAANIALALLNARTQTEVAARQQFITDGPQYNAIGEALVHSLDATAAATKRTLTPASQMALQAIRRVFCSVIVRLPVDQRFGRRSRKLLPT